MNASMTLNYRRLAEYAKNPLRKLFYTLEHRKLRNFEPDFARRFDRVLLISKHDYAAIAHERHLTNVFFNPHGVDCDFFSPDPTVDKTPGSIVFSGNMSYAPNVDAITVFCNEVLPKIQRSVPNVKLTIVGADPKPEVRALAERFPVEVTGRLPDIRGFLNRAEVGIAPMRIAAGLQNKVLEGMSMGLPMVITHAATEAIRTSHGEDVFLADSSDDFATSVVKLLRDSELRARMGAAARKFILSDWTWETHFNELEGLFEEMHRVRKEPRRTSVAQPADRSFPQRESPEGRP